MITYTYKCSDCSHTFDIKQRITDEELNHCPVCNLPSLKKVIGLANFSLKGEGWAGKEIRANSTR